MASNIEKKGKIAVIGRFVYFERHQLVLHLHRVTLMPIFDDHIQFSLYIK